VCKVKVREPRMYQSTSDDMIAYSLLLFLSYQTKEPFTDEMSAGNYQ